MNHWQVSSLKSFTRATPIAYASSIIRVSRTGCTPIQVAASDGHVYWVKPQNNAHGLLSIVAERVVAAAAKYLGAPAAESVLLTIPPGWSDPEYNAPGHVIQPGTAHASRVIGGNLLEDTSLQYISRDGNSQRAPAFIALWEWCCGEDGQWGYDVSADHTMWTFDHGFWLGGGGEWSIEDLPGWASISNGWTGSLGGMDADVFLGLADRLKECTVADVLEIVSAVPVDWGITDEQLIVIANWLYGRRTLVARNLNKHAATITRRG